MKGQGISSQLYLHDNSIYYALLFFLCPIVSSEARSPCIVTAVPFDGIFLGHLIRKVSVLTFELLLLVFLHALFLFALCLLV